MDNNILAGLTLSVVGLIVAFAFMALFILVMVVLQKLFPPKAEPAVTLAEQTNESPVLEVENNASTEDAGLIAAIAAAISFARAKSQSQLGSTLQFGHGSWWTTHQASARQDSELIRR